MNVFKNWNIKKFYTNLISGNFRTPVKSNPLDTPPQGGSGSPSGNPSGSGQPTPPQGSSGSDSGGGRPAPPPDGPGNPSGSSSGSGETSAG